MDIRATVQQPHWVPTSCTLPVATQPLRLAEFDDLFAQHVQEVQHGDGTLTLTLVREPHSAATAASLAARDTRCCSFFTFDLHIADGSHARREHRAVARRRACGLGRAGQGPRRVGSMSLRTGEVARAARVDVQTLRYYERLGLPDEPNRTLTRVDLHQVQQRLADLTAVRDSLHAALDAGCDDLLSCAHNPHCPLPFVEPTSSTTTPPPD